MKKKIVLSVLIIVALFANTDKVLAQTERDFYSIIDDISTERIKQDITTLANFGTRHTLSDTLSKTRGIGAARGGFLIVLKKYLRIVQAVLK